MELTDNEILELERLLVEQEIDLLKEGLTVFNNKTNPNYIHLYDSINSQIIDKEGDLIEGYSGSIMEGSSRSGKTWSWIFIIVYLTTIKHKNESIKINVYREHFADFKKTLFDDFKRVLDLFGLPNKFHNAERVESFKIDESTVHLLGCDKLKGSGHGSGCDYAVFNEMMFIDKKTYLQAVKRCRKFWIGDYNPSFTDHWVFNSVITRPDVSFIQTTFKDNPFVSAKEKIEILATEPYLPGSYEVTEDSILYKGKPVTDKNQPPPHPTNIENGTADEFEWLVYGLGLRGAMKGVIFKQLNWIDEFPDIAYTYANDFGFTSDPNALVRYAEDEKNIWFELLSYTPIETVDELDEYMTTIGVEKDTLITCDSSDKHTSENKGTVEMVKGLKNKGWKAKKVKKKRSVMYWILSMKKKKIHCVKNRFWKDVKTERENYRFKEVQGIQINQPIDKYNHIWDAVRYGHIAHNTQVELPEPKSLSEMGINY
ncbi:phage terminase large subunit [Aquimarina hainanensis]|uniref:Phage terminase large subunit n=2 Tax=Aquimarina hainanensis TaxID=1578017 RepID=A0ABW5NBU7_9FLAO